MANYPRVTSLIELDALVGEFVVGETPEVHWEDSHGTFQFETEEEARRAIRDPYYQNFLPDVDWSTTVVRKVLIYRPYVTDALAFWRMVGEATQHSGALKLSRDKGQWAAAFGKSGEGRALSPQLAVCLAALACKGVKAEIDHARLEHQLGLILGQPAEPLPVA
jgi:hypothetical protein